MSDVGDRPQGWWLASDGRWYPPETRPPQPTTTVVLGSTGAPPGAIAQTSSVLLNLLWLAFAGVWLCLWYVMAGIVCMLTVIGIPFGVQSFKLAGYALWPFGRVVIERPGRDAGISCLGNLFWFVLFGWHLAFLHLLAGVLLCITIVGIPLGLGSFKMAGLAVAPFGKQVIPRRDLARMPQVVVVSHVG